MQYYLSNPIAVNVWTDTERAQIAMNCANGPKNKIDNELSLSNFHVFHFYNERHLI